MGASPLEENLRNLSDSIGGRVTGTPAADRATGWAVQAFRLSGVDEVHTEKYTIPVGWSEGNTRLEILAPEPFPVRLVSIGWSPATPEGGVTANIVDVGFGDEAGFAKAGAGVNGAIVLVHSNFLVTWEQLTAEYDIAPPIIERAMKGGAKAMLWMSSRPNLLLYRHTVSVDGQLEKMPQAVVAREDAERIARFLAGGQPVRVHFEMPNRISGPVSAENVVAEIRGREKPDEFVVLGAHLDSWDLGTGALDNGCNSAHGDRRGANDPCLGHDSAAFDSVYFVHRRRRRFAGVGGIRARSPRGTGSNDCGGGFRFRNRQSYRLFRWADARTSLRRCANPWSRWRDWG